MLVSPRYSPHHHTGRLRPHRETSYGPLLFVLLLAVLGLMGVSVATNAAGQGQGGTLTKEQPTAAPTISSPAKGQSFPTNPITVSGTCPEQTLVKLFKNKVFAGSTVCEDGGKFSLQMDLVVGANSLTAEAAGADKSGPASAPVDVALDVAPGGPGFSTELVLQSISSHRNALVGGEVVWPVEILGGQAPYALSFDWGDKSSDVLTRPTQGSLTQKHTYKTAGGYMGSYITVVRATDAAQHTAYMQLVTLVTDPAPKAQASWLNMNTILMGIGGLVFVVLSFWLGERREKSILSRRLAMLR